MITAIIVAIITAVVVIAAVMLVFRWLANNRKAEDTHHMKVKNISTVGAATNLKDDLGTTPAPYVGTSAPSGIPADSLRERFVALGVLATAIFGALFVKLFSLQVLGTSKYSTQAKDNMYASVYSPAPRGYIYDATGTTLVGNRSSLTILADSDVADDPDIILRLSALLGIPRNIIKQRIMDETSGAQNTRVVKADATMREIAFISEHPDAFSGVSCETRTVREYYYGGLAAHTLGYTGTVSEQEMTTASEGRTIQLGDDVGKAGVESYYDNVLAGSHGKKTVITDAQGNVVKVTSEIQATKGNDIYLNLRADVQYCVDARLAAQIAPSGEIGSGKGVAGAVVVMDVKTGAIVALSSFPTFLPGAFVGGISDEMWDIYNSDDSYNPLLNRSIAGTYPAASTFKAFTGMAGLEYGYADTTKTWDCEGSWDGFNTGVPQKCWNTSGHGDLGFRMGIIESCDVVFYEIAKDFFDNRASVGKTAMQDEVMKYGFGKLTGIDLAGEEYGRVPTPDWKSEYFKDVPEEATWRGGDLTNMSIGQGYILITPIQLAVGYGGIATGKLMKPHILKEVRNSQGEVVVSVEPEVIGEPDVKAENLEIMRDALHAVRNENASVKQHFDKWKIDAAAKTGTAEVSGKSDFGWSACYGPFDDPKYVCTCIIEEGGGGGTAAMPVAAACLAYALQADAGTLDVNPGYIQGSLGKVLDSAGKTSNTGRTD